MTSIRQSNPVSVTPRAVGPSGRAVDEYRKCIKPSDTSLCRLVSPRPPTATYVQLSSTIQHETTPTEHAEFLTTDQKVRGSSPFERAGGGRPKWPLTCIFAQGTMPGGYRGDTLRSSISRTNRAFAGG